MSAPTDRHGQPRGFFHYRRNREKAFHHLYGILHGISADRQLTDTEIEHLQAWLADNTFIADDPDIADLRADLARVLDDGVITSEERQDLLGVIETILEFRGGQPRDDKEAVNTLHGFVSGIAADRALVDVEIHELESWLESNRQFCASFPLDVVLDRVSAILADRHISEDERADLLETIDALQGGSLVETGTAGGLATRYTFDEPETLEHEGHRFCIIGKFALGPRKAVRQRLEARGASTTDSVSGKVSYLLVGTFASRDWVGTSHGRKIEQAMEYRESEGSPLILAEEHWLAAIDSQQ